MPIERDGAKYLIRVFYKVNKNPTRDVRNVNCDSLDQAWAMVHKLKTDPTVHRLQLCSVLEDFTLEV